MTPTDRELLDSLLRELMDLKRRVERSGKVGIADLLYPIALAKKLKEKIIYGR